MKILYLNWLRLTGIALYPFILINTRFRHDGTVLNHERIHIRQQIECGILFFYIFYVLNYLYNLIRYRNHNKAYRNILFEREAYRFENDSSYLQKRRAYSFFRQG
ncbi:MAG TPA: hypothetical protein PLU53_01180 [Bacteroidia bacterium]|nr:hypothetical protein [Bacteroidia bacterium]